MRGKSHHCLGEFLVGKYMSDTPRRCVGAFLFGCIQPDRNPLTYLKGSLRRQWLRGHNFENAKRYMYRLAGHLEEKQRWSMLDYYKLGKLAHYTADAFTYAHNVYFGTDLTRHQRYEAALQEYFLKYLRSHPEIDPKPFRSAAQTIGRFHLVYSRNPRGITTDSYYALTVCCCILALLLPSQS